jgi:hypothetical protein
MSVTERLCTLPTRIAAALADLGLGHRARTADTCGVAKVSTDDLRTVGSSDIRKAVHALPSRSRQCSHADWRLMPSMAATSAQEAPLFRAVFTAFISACCNRPRIRRMSCKAALN